MAPTHFDLTTASIADINAAFDASALTSERLVQLCLDRIEAYDDAGPVKNLKDQGVDVLNQHQDCPGAGIQAAEMAGMFSVGYHIDGSLPRMAG